MDGILGPADSLGDEGACVVSGGKWYGVFLTTDSIGAHATRFNAADVGEKGLYRGVMDTTAVLAQIRAQNDAITRGYEDYKKANRSFSPLAFRTDGDSISVWLVPRGSSGPVLGGERGYLYSPDGHTLVRQADDFASYRPFVLADTGVVVIASAGDSVPTMSEMMGANLVNEIGRNVRIETKARSSTLTSRGAAAVWVHIRKPR